MKPRAVIAPAAPRPVGAYSHAVVAGDLAFLSGQIALDPSTGKMIAGDVGAQTRQVLENMIRVLHALGLELRDVVKTTVFLSDIADGAAVNAIYGEHFPTDPPARSTIAVAGLPAGALVEIEAVAAMRDHAPA